MMRCVKISRFGGERGSTFIGALFLILGLGVLGSAVGGIVSEDQEASINQISTSQALYIGHAGLEFAKGRLDQGNNPVVEDQPFGDGTFTITSDPSVSQIIVNSAYGAAKKEQSINAVFAKDCVTLDSTAVYIQGNSVMDLKLVKTCNLGVTISEIAVDWNWPKCGVGNGSTPYDNYADPDNPDKIFICHLPNCDEDKANTVSVSIADWESGGHASHECDYLGECGASEDGAGWGEGSGSDEVDGACSDFDHEGDHDHQDALVTALGFNGATVYSASLGIGSPTPNGAQPAEQINNVDATITANDTYLFTGGENGIVFSQTPVASGWYSVTVYFADGSSIGTVFTP